MSDSIHKKFFSKVSFIINNEFYNKKGFNLGIPRLTNKVYYFDNDRLGTSFYFIDDNTVNKNEFESIYSYIWNENHVNLFFLPKENSDILNLYYAKTNPKKRKITIDSFSCTDVDENIVNKINKSNFSNGSVWLAYNQKLELIKKNKISVDKALVKTLKKLKISLDNTYQSIINNEDKKSEIVQSLIDRTLFIKYLEDNHIINSFFYKHYFKAELSFKTLLQNKDKCNINKLFQSLNSVFNIKLFEVPQIEEKLILDRACELINDTLSATDESGQLSLFDFKFNIIPIEFISLIYEIFLEDISTNEGIYYTPEGLANLVIEETIEKKTGKVLDPACGSGIFLIKAFRKLLSISQINTDNIKDTLRKKNEVLSKYIFGIEKNRVARRLTIFSLYLEMLRNTKAEDINNLVKFSIEDKSYQIFPLDIENNIRLENTISNDVKFNFNKFDYIVGNPPWKKIKPYDDEHKFYVENNKYIDQAQLSEAFIIKIDQWMDVNTKVGFIINNSSLFSESTNFLNYLLSNYDILKIYDLSSLDNLFLSSTESALILFYNKQNFKNNFGNNIIQFISPQKTYLSEILDIIQIQSDDIKEISQFILQQNPQNIRQLVHQNPVDENILTKIKNNQIKIKDLLIDSEDGFYGIEVSSTSSVLKQFNLSESDWKQLSKKQKIYFYNRNRSTMINNKRTKEFDISFYEPSDISQYKLNACTKYLSQNRSNLRRPKRDNLFRGNKILVNRTGIKLEATFSNDYIYFSSSVLCFKPKTENDLYILLALINSNLINYIINKYFRKRSNDSFPKINKNDILDFNIPEFKNNEKFDEIKKIVKRIIVLNNSNNNEKINIIDIEKAKINMLIYDIYNLTFYERQKIEDSFIDKNLEANRSNLDKYREKFVKILKYYISEEKILSSKCYIFDDLPINIAIIEFTLNEMCEENPKPQKISKYTLIEIFNNIGIKNVLSLRDRIYTKNSIYIIKEFKKINWTISKAFEDANIELGKIFNEQRDM